MCEIDINVINLEPRTWKLQKTFVYYQPPDSGQENKTTDLENINKMEFYLKRPSFLEEFTFEEKTAPCYLVQNGAC